MTDNIDYSEQIYNSEFRPGYIRPDGSIVQAPQPPAYPNPPAPQEPQAPVTSRIQPHTLIKVRSYCGLAGEIVSTIEPYTEADPFAILAHFLAGFGNLIGPGPHFTVEYDLHSLRLYVALVGDSSKGRKGQSWSTPKRLLTQTDPSWAERIISGLSSGEGLINAVRDSRGDDSGEPDKRLLVVESEFAQALKVMRREGNILSPTIRDAWDHGNLSPLTKANPIRATGAHISIVGHITRGELLRYLTETEQGNGFANRFIWLHVKRSKIISNPTGTPPELLTPLIRKIKEAYLFGRTVQQINRDPEAEALWTDIYPELSEGKPGLLGAVTNRAEAQVMRIACIYAILDMSYVVRLEHLNAALAFWKYSENSVRWIFGSKIGNEIADKILKALQERGLLTSTDIRNLFNKNKKAIETSNALEELQNLGLVTSTQEKTEGRPSTVWRPTT